MNLIKQLKTTPKWKEFEEWYNKFVPTYSLGNKAWLKDINYTTGEGEVDFLELPFEFQKGVFEKFIESQGYRFLVENSTDKIQHLLTKPLELGRLLVIRDSFEELLIWYFNN